MEGDAGFAEAGALEGAAAEEAVEFDDRALPGAKEEAAEEAAKEFCAEEALLCSCCAEETGAKELAVTSEGPGGWVREEQEQKIKREERSAAIHFFCFMEPLSIHEFTRQSPPG